jgi:uncharacterized membrane protein
MIGAIYFACCYFSLQFAYGPIQCRIAESLTLLPLLFPEAIIGVTIGCLIFNVTTGVIYDIVFGTLCTLSACLLTYLIGKFIKKDSLKIIIGGIPPVIINAIFIPLILIYGYKLEEGYLFLFGTLFLGQFISVYILGTVIYFPIKKILLKHNITKRKD